MQPLETKTKPQIPETSLGKTIVDNSELNANQIIHGDQLPKGRESQWQYPIEENPTFVGEKYDAMQQAGITETKERIGQLSNKNKQGFASIIEEQAPAFIMGRYEDWKGHQSKRYVARAVVKLMGSDPGAPIPESRIGQKIRNKKDTVRENRSWTHWLQDGASNEEFINFTQWYNYRVEKLQSDPTAVETIKQEKQEYKTGLQDGIDKGYLDAEDVDRVVKEVDGYPVLIGEFIDTHARDYGGYADLENGYAVVSEGDPKEERSERLVTAIKHATKHELNHAVLGSLKEYSTYSWLDEAVTEHISVAIKTADWETLSPSDLAETYGLYRELVSTVMSSGNEVLSTKLLTLAYSAKIHGSQGTIAITKESLRSSLSSAYDTEADVLEVIDWAIINSENNLKTNVFLPGHSRSEIAASIVSKKWKHPRQRNRLIKAYLKDKEKEDF
jgi:hypothetical protein